MLTRYVVVEIFQATSFSLVMHNSGPPSRNRTHQTRYAPLHSTSESGLNCTPTHARSHQIEPYKSTLGNLIATQHRKKAAFFTSRLAGYVVSSLNTTGVGFIKSMTDVERHAELVYAESLFEKVGAA